MYLSIHQLKKTFGEKTAVDVDDFRIESGTILGLVGNNGAGKTTLFRLLLDLLNADSGEVTMSFDIAPSSEGAPTEALTVNPAKSEEWKQHTGAHIDEGFLIDFLTPEEYFSFVGQVSGMNKEAIEARMHDFDSLMAGEILGQKKLIRDFSSGNRQKIGIISALFNRPKLVILDEPFNFLDPSGQNILKHMLKEYGESSGGIVMVSSHNLTHTVDISTRIALMESGRIIRDINTSSGDAMKELEAYFG